MNISALNINNRSFGSRNKNIRTADNILRASKNTFPMVSSTYIDTFYSAKTPQKAELRGNVFTKIRNEIESVRDVYLSRNPRIYMSELTKEDAKSRNNALLKAVSKKKVGNCDENAAIGLAALAANGFYDSKRARLVLRTTFFDKNDGEKVFCKRDDLDHVFVVTSMGKESDKENDLIVVDPWLGFADSLSGAKAKFKQVLYKDCIETVEDKHKKLFLKEMEKRGKSTNLDDYEIRHSLDFAPYDILTKSEIKELGEYARKEYASLIK